MKIYFKKTIILIFVLFLIILLPTTHSLAAYIIYIDEGNGKLTPPPTNTDYKKIYETIDQLSWPNNLNELKRMVNKSLPEYITNRKPGAEQNHIEHVLRQENDKIRLLWVPTTLFQMAAILSPEFCPNLGKRDSNLRLPEEIALSFYFNINQFLLKNLSSHYTDLLNNAIQHQKWFPYINSLHETYEQITDFYNIPRSINPLSTLHPNVLTEIFKIEAMCYFNNDFPLYRSSTAIFYKDGQPGTFKKALDTITVGNEIRESKIIIVDPKMSGKAFGISISNTFFAGYSDKSACTFRIFTNNWNSCRSGKPNLYALTINKKQYLEKYRDILHWPPSNPITDLCKMGEFFHPRSAGNKSYTTSGTYETYSPKVMIITKDFYDVTITKKIIQSKSAYDNPNITSAMDLVIRKQNPIENKEKLIQLLAIENAPLSNDISKEDIMTIFLDHHSELEINYLMSHFIADYMKVIHDGENILIHHVNENQHPDNELYNNQLELGREISNNCLKIWRNGTSNITREEILNRHIKTILL